MSGWARAIIMTPRCGGPDGVSAVTRLYVNVLAAQLGSGVARLDVWSLDDSTTGIQDDRVSVRCAGGSRLRFATFGLCGGRIDECTLVIVQHVHLLPVALPLVWRGARVILQLHGVEAWKRLRPLERAGCRAAWKVVAVSSHTTERFRRANPDLANCAVEVCPPGLPALRTVESGVQVGSPYALIVARMSSEERYKGHDLLIEIWPRVRQAVPDAQLVVVGGGDDRPRLLAKSKALGLQSSVRFEGVVDDARLAALYRDATVFVMPSPNEGFGLVYVEAMSVGVPCVVATGAAEEIVDHGTTGIVVAPGDARALEAAIVQLLTSPAERRRMSTAAAEDARRRFSADAFARRVYGVLQLPQVPAAC